MTPSLRSSSSDSFNDDGDDEEKSLGHLCVCACVFASKPLDTLTVSVSVLLLWLLLSSFARPSCSHRLPVSLLLSHLKLEETGGTLFPSFLYFWVGTSHSLPTQHTRQSTRQTIMQPSLSLSLRFSWTAEKRRTKQQDNKHNKRGEERKKKKAQESTGMDQITHSRVLRSCFSPFISH